MKKINAPVRLRKNFSLNSYEFKYEGNKIHTYINPNKNGYVIYALEAHEYDDESRPVYPYFITDLNCNISREWEDALVFNTKEEAIENLDKTGTRFPHVYKITKGIIDLKKEII